MEPYFKNETLFDNSLSELMLLPLEGLLDVNFNVPIMEVIEQAQELYNLSSKELNYSSSAEFNLDSCSGSDLDSNCASPVSSPSVMRDGKLILTCDHEGCDKTFMTQANKRRHERLHSGDKPHFCPEVGCGRNFARKYDLKVHMRIHTKEKPYGCTFEGCGKLFGRSSSLREHERNIHNVYQSRRDQRAQQTEQPL
eukprot:TRINITY_DN7707_c0_g1_i1.p1 TRINITY_DN7707_c0_g1~~TRINITY_DN7707_c0_g1_i1.p1  ORF type:complete len:196 (+),score=25.91 TRINITY_DN7707_c0_g1_i1:277-864(+)